MNWNLYANKYPNGRFSHVGRKRWVELHNCGEIYPVTVSEDPEGDYWGWRDASKPVSDPPCMIQQARIVLDMCFPYGVDNAIETKQGSIVRLTIVPRSEE
jgi:hypothetical protein